MRGLSMRNEKEMMKLIIDVAKADERIRAVLLSGSRANPNVPKDIYQDYDITFFVLDIGPFYNNPTWVESQFGKPLIMQMPEAMRNPTGDGNFNYMMIYPDGNRIDLSFEFKRYIDNGEPAIVLLDKDKGNGFLPILPVPNDKHWHIKKPSPLYFYSCCNNFWWCLNNVAKGIARDELPYVMQMLNDVVRSELHDMINYYIGTQDGYNLSTGKDGKYFKKYLPLELYERYEATYSSSNYDDIWNSVDMMCDLFHDLAKIVAQYFEFEYCLDEEDGIRVYLKMIKEATSPNDFSSSK
jgi:aminoglycoside 6-adenylyltransferase